MFSHRMENPLCCFSTRKRSHTFPSSLPEIREQLYTQPPPHARCFMKLLSNEIILSIFRLLTLTDLCSVARANKQLHDCAYDTSLWRNFILSSTMKPRKINLALKAMEQSSRLSCVRSVNINNSNIKTSAVEYIIEHSPCLKEIRFHNLKLTERIAKLLVACCPALEQVYMEGGMTTDECLELLSNGAIRLKSINLHKVENITTTGICHIIKNTNLSFLNFNGISGWDIRTLAPYCTHFTSMDLGSSNNLTDEDLKSLTKNCSKLRFISLKQCRAITDTGVQELIMDCPQLADLNISACNKISQPSIQHAMQSLHFLNSLNISRLKSVHPIPFPRFPYRIMTSLTAIDMSFTNISDDDLRFLSEFCPYLKTLKITGCTGITDDGMLHLAKCTKLTNLDASRDSTTTSMNFTITSISALASLCADLHKISLSPSAKNKITKSALGDLNEKRFAGDLPLIAFHLNEDLVEN
eukprot:TRINITY_DN2220_c0_g1_i2.p1 TRINITY_DN2220_c0_g1~~TRINITY_DN2220_c0_g1_i2.p1  ORF type:complete len:469 (-),score=73.65 TRINITY_DN2220_c0_g1_i2:79-1485(-)